MRNLTGSTLSCGTAPARSGAFRRRAEAAARHSLRRRALRCPKENLAMGCARGAGRRTHTVSWAGSLLVHGLILFAGFSFLIRPVRLDVTSGKTSTELALVAAPPEAATPSRPKPAVVPATVPPPLAQAVLPPVPLHVVVKVVAETVPRAATVATPVREHPAAKPVARIAARATRDATPADRGAVRARPDEVANQPPVYPEDSRAAREEGVVMLRVEVAPTGSAGRVAVLQSSGYFRLDQAARRAVQAWRFYPASIGTETIPSEVDVPVRFILQ